MCTVDKRTITHVNSRMIEHVKVHHIPVQKVRDNQIVVPVRILGSRPYRISIEKVNEIYGKARQKVIGVKDGKKVL